MISAIFDVEISHLVLKSAPGYLGFPRMMSTSARRNKSTSRSRASRVSRVEHRRETRHNLRLRSNFEWADTEGIIHTAQGFTRDIGSKGMFIYTDSQPPLMAELHVEVFLSSDEEVRKDLQLRLCASALVLRVDPIAAGLSGGFAILNKSYELLRGEVVLKD